MTIKTCAVAGSFYSNESTQLSNQIDQLLEHNPCSGDQPSVLIVPHAAPVYSGKIAALAYNLIKPYLHHYKRIVILGPAHRVAFNYHAALNATQWHTPLGAINIDKAYNDQLIEQGHMQYFDQAHAQEHSLEVQLPFLQSVGLAEIPIVPIVIGRAANQQSCALMDALLKDKDNCVIISSDMSHFKNYQQAVDYDRLTIETINNMQPLSSAEQACGCYPINALLNGDMQQSLEAKLLGYCNSGDTGGDKNRVVGYAAFAFYPKFNAQRKQQMLALARYEITKAFNVDDGLLASQLNTCGDLQAQYLQQPLACFVTLNILSAPSDPSNTSCKTLRGCIGNLQANGTLVQSIQRNATLAAFKDHRFTPLAEHELADICIEISLLTPAKPMSVNSHDALINQLQPHRDGLILKCAHHQATFLPSVWEQLPDPQQFVKHLKVKAGLAEDFWSDDMKCYRYQAIKFSERD